MMNIEIRLKILELAVNTMTDVETADEVIERARKYAGFVSDAPRVSITMRGSSVSCGDIPSDTAVSIPAE